MLLQVWLPLIGGLTVFLALSALTIAGAFLGSSQIERWANLSAVYIILPVLFVGLLLLGLLSGGIYGVAKLLKAMPRWMFIAQGGFQRASVIARKAADAAAQPFFSAHASSARARAFWKQIFH